MVGFASQFGTVGPEPSDDIIDVFDGKHDATYAQRVRGASTCARWLETCSPCPRALVIYAH